MRTITWRERLIPTAIVIMLGAAGLLTLAFPAGSSAQVTEPPRLVQPEDRATLPDFGPTLNWANPAGTTQYQLQVTPAQNDGPGINLIIGGSGQTFAVPPPPRWYGLLPAMSYSWRVRASDSAAAVDEGDASWGPWSEPRTFRTPAVSSSSVTLANPANGVAVASVTPTLSWTDANGSIYYYEVQVSRDPGFGTGAFLYSALLHGGVTTPANSYVIPAAFPLERGATYHWRVRPRIQGDGTPVDWSLASSFRPPAASPAPPGATALFLQVTAPADNITVTAASLTVTGRTAPGALVTVDAALATVQADGSFSASITLEEGPNLIDIIASNAAGDTQVVTLTLHYIP